MISRYNVIYVLNGERKVEFFFNDVYKAMKRVEELNRNPSVSEAKLDIKY